MVRIHHRPPRQTVCKPRLDQSGDLRPPIRTWRLVLHTTVADVNVGEQRRQQLAAHYAVAGVAGLDEPESVGSSALGPVRLVAAFATPSSRSRLARYLGSSQLPQGNKWLSLSRPRSWTRSRQANKQSGLSSSGQWATRSPLASVFPSPPAVPEPTG